MEAPAPGAAHDAAAQDVHSATRRRLDAYTYLSAPERLEHVAITRVFSGTLLADLAVPDVLAELRQPAAQPPGSMPTPSRSGWNSWCGGATCCAAATP
ncbi:hypothetical protein ACF061_37235 [Streptomyces sp. NPDC015220]|uniref:hypothetical protein n=1 Tax=Streptomyces sp. NPDC015220 TaxID=3364947 RepID=UPI0036FAEE92